MNTDKEMPTLGGSVGQQICLGRWGIAPAAYAEMLSTKITKAIGLGHKKCFEGFALKMEKITQAGLEEVSAGAQTGIELLKAWGIPAEAYAHMNAERISKVLALGEQQCRRGFALKMAVIAAAAAMAAETKPTAEEGLDDILAWDGVPSEEDADEERSGFRVYDSLEDDCLED